MRQSDSGSRGRLMTIALLVAIPVIIITVYFKIRSDAADAAADTVPAQVVKQSAVVADTVEVPEVNATVEEPVEVAVSDSVGIDRRPAMEAGNEDGYWDGWYDGAETGERQRYDESSSYASAEDRRVYAENYREGYERGFAEALENRKK